MKLIIAVFVLLAVQQTLAQYQKGDWAKDRINSLRTMRTSVAMMYNTQTTTLGMLAMTLGGNAGSMFDNLRNLANSSTITDKNKKALLNMLSSGTNQFNGIMSLIKSGDDALIKIVSDKLDELEIPLELNYLAIDDIYTTQMQQAMNSQSSSYYILVNCATSFDMPIMDVWNRKTQEIQGIFQYQNDPSTIYSSLQSNPIVVAVQNLTDTYSLRLANCGSIPSDACVNDLVALFPTGKNTPITDLRSWVSSEITNTRNIVRPAVAASIKNGLLQADAIKKSVAGCLVYFPPKAQTPAKP